MKHKTTKKICNIGRRATALLMAAFISVNTIFAGGIVAFADDTGCSAEKRLELLETEESMEEIFYEIEEEYSEATEEYEAALEAYDEAYAAYIIAEDDALSAEAAADNAKTALEEASNALLEVENVNVSDMESVLSEIEILESQIEEAEAEAEELASAAEAAQEVYNETVSAYSEAQTALSTAEEELAAAVEELSEIATTMASETEALITGYENENNSLYALINWMLDGYEEYTKETLSDDQVTELTLSQSNLSAIMSGDSGWFNSSYSYSSDDIDPTSSTDALALTNVLTSLDIIDSINELRATDDNYVGYEDCLTNFVMMVGSAYTADVSIY